jgi:hypothetical protein
MNPMDNLRDLLLKEWHVELFRNALGSYTAIARRDDGEIITDDHTLEKTVQRIWDKIHKVGDYADQ